MKSLLSLCPFALSVALVLGAFGNASVGAQGSPTDELLRITVDEVTKPTLFDLQRVQTLVAGGADLSARNPSGAYPFLLAAESYTYMAATADPDTSKALDVAKFLISQGSDVSSADGRGFTPAMYLTYFGPTDISPLWNPILAAHPDLGASGAGGATLMQVLVSKSGRLDQFETAMAGLQTYKINLSAIDELGQSLFHSAARAGVQDANGKLLIQRLADVLPASEAARLADLPDQSGMTPLMMAVQFNRKSVVQYLLDQFKLDVNRENDDEESALGIAVSKNYSDVANLLRAAGSHEPQVDDPNILFCHRVNHGSFDVARLRKLIFQTCPNSIKSVDDLLPLLPKSLRAHHIFMYGTQGLATSTLTNPRVMLYGKTANLILAFSAKGMASDNVLEFMDFDQTQKVFNFDEIDFPTAAGQKTTFTANPTTCVKCHGSPAHPVWNSWSLWPGAYRGDMETFFPGQGGDRGDFQTFMDHVKNDPQSRYAQLPPMSTAYTHSPLGGYVFPDPNLSLDFLLDGMNGQRMAQEVANSQVLRSLRYAILGVLSCQQPVTDFVPAQLQSLLPQTVDALVADTTTHAVGEQQSRIRRQAFLKPGSPVGRYNFQRLIGINYSDSNDAGFSGEIQRISKMRYLVEGVLGAGAIGGWFMPFNDNQPSYVAVDWTNFEAQAWKVLLDPKADADLVAIYSAAYKDIAIGQVPSWMYTGSSSAGTQLCPLLQQKSLNLLARRRNFSN